MGRKNQIVKRIKDPEKEAHEKEEEEMLLQQKNEDKKESIIKHNINKDDLIWDIKSSLLEYCDEYAIPLCDYLTFDMLQGFVEYLST